MPLEAEDVPGPGRRSGPKRPRTQKRMLIVNSYDSAVGGSEHSRFGQPWVRRDPPFASIPPRR